MKKFLRDLFVIILGIFIGGWTFLISTEYLNEYYQTWILQVPDPALGPPGLEY